MDERSKSTDRGNGVSCYVVRCRRECELHLHLQRTIAMEMMGLSLVCCDELFSKHA